MLHTHGHPCEVLPWLLLPAAGCRHLLLPLLRMQRLPAVAALPLLSGRQQRPGWHRPLMHTLRKQVTNNGRRTM